MTEIIVLRNVTCNLYKQQFTYILYIKSYIKYRKKTKKDHSFLIHSSLLLICQNKSSEFVIKMKNTQPE